jgi:Asp-tRNA(Asn)/Glu-tRNA(Gln) amidotransferase A subunit family amidase
MSSIMLRTTLGSAGDNMSLPLHELSATEAARRLAAGEISAVDYAQALIERVDAVEPEVLAWTQLDRAALLEQAQRADDRHRRGLAAGPLSGIAVGVKDIIDTRFVLTERGTSLYRGRMPSEDAALVRNLRRAGGLMMGKTVTTELATYAPGKTRNPHHGGHTPGGSSSGSAAAVAAGMVPLAVGTQTNGSMIRPASFCGVVGFKPSFGLIPRSGVLVQSPHLDQIGVFGRRVEDVALLAEALCGDDPADPRAAPMPTPPLLSVAATEPPLPPRLAFVRTAFWSRLDEDARAAFETCAGALGRHSEAIDLPLDIEQAVQTHRLIMEADLAASYADEYARGKEQLSASLRSQIERGQQTRAVDYRRAVESIAGMQAALDEVFDRFDAILTPATLGTAPAGLESTGDPLMCTLWTLTGLPAVSLPLLHGANGLPLGVQLVGRREDDARLLRTARWLTAFMAASAN